MRRDEIEEITRQERSYAAIQYMRIALEALGCVQVRQALEESQRDNFDRLYIELAGMLSELKVERPKAGRPFERIA